MVEYRELLPEYLGGPNIEAHAAIIEGADKYFNKLIELLNLWNTLERPILIQRVQDNTGGQNTVTIYINTPAPITEIKIEGDINETITPPDNTIYNYINSWVIPEPSKIICHATMWVKMPVLTVTVKTETNIYKKAYPENDIMENNPADHDKFIDIMGELLGVPRRKYKDFLITFQNLAGTVPLAFLKEKETRGDGNEYALPCTEDDYYYKNRLETFMRSNKTLTDFLTVFYSQSTRVLNHPETFLFPIMRDNKKDIFLLCAINYLTNIDISSFEQDMQGYAPINRQVHLITPENTKIVLTTVHAAPNSLILDLLYIIGNNNEEVPPNPETITNAIFDVKIQGHPIGRVTSDINGRFTVNVGGVGLYGQYHIAEIYFAAVERPNYIKTVYDAWNTIPISSNFILTFERGAWQYKKYFNTSVTDFENPTIRDNNNLNCGRGMLVYTPAINPQLVDLTNYTLTVKFHHTTGEQRILFGTLEITTEDTARIYGMNNTPRTYETDTQLITDTHTFTYKFTNGVCSLLFDGVDTGVTYDFSNTTDMIYLAGMNNRANGDIRGLHFEEITATMQ